jgi:hypothetical protein
MLIIDAHVTISVDGGHLPGPDRSLRNLQLSGTKNCLGFTLFVHSYFLTSARVRYKDKEVREVLGQLPEVLHSCLRMETYGQFLRPCGHRGRTCISPLRLQKRHNLRKIARSYSTGECRHVVPAVVDSND